MSRLFDGKYDVNDTGKVTESNPLAAKVFCRNVKKVRSLLSDGADPNSCDFWGTPVLTVAVGTGVTELVDVLLKHGADPNILLEGVGANAPLMQAVTSYNVPAGDTEIMELLLKYGADVDLQDNNKQTALMYACSQGTNTLRDASLLKRVECLLDHGASIESRDSACRTPLIIAAEHGQTDVLYILLQKGAKLDSMDLKGRNATIAAWLKGREKAFEVLVAAGGLNGISPAYMLKQVGSREKDGTARTGQLGIMLALLAKAILPETDKSLDAVTAELSSHSVKYFFSRFYTGYLSQERFLELVSMGDTKQISVSEENAKKLVKALLDTFEASPDVVVKFVEKRIGTGLQEWVDNRVDGVDSLVAKLAGKIRHRESVLNAAAGDGVVFF